MRPVVYLLLVLFFVGCQSRRTVLHTGQIIALSDSMLSAGSVDTVRFGRLKAGEVGIKQLRLQNASSRTLVVTHYEVSCQCVTPEFDRQPLRPGDATPLSIRFDSRGEQGWQMKLLKIYTSESSIPLKIYVEADVD